MSVERRNLYKVFRSGVYLGLLPTPTNDFSYSQDINTASTEIEIEIPQTLDVSGQSVEPIETQDGLPLQTENELTVTTERATENVGVSTSGRLIANGNDIEVWEYSDNHPNGVIVFSGYQSRMRGRVGEGDVLTLTIISNGRDLDDYIFGNDDFTLLISQTLTGDDFGIWASRRAGQGFTTTAGQTTLAKIVLRLLTVSAQTRTVTMKLWNSEAQAQPLGATPLATTSISLNNINYAEYDFVFPSPIVVTPNTYYFFSIEVDAASIFSDVNTWLGFDAGAASPYAGGSGKRSEGYAAWLEFTTNTDFYFKIYSGSLLTNAVFTSADPSDMVTDAIDGYQSQGGDVTYTGSSIELTGYSLDYTFVTATVLEIIEKARELAPANFYWFVDPATNVITFKQTETTAEHTFTLGRHLNSIQIEATIENIKNVVYFIGGPTAGVNLLALYTDVASLNTNRRGMARLTDNRIPVADEPSAASIADSYMDERNSEDYLADPITILAETYDISTIKLGQTVSVQGFGNFIDTLVMQITSLERTLTYAQLTLGTLPFKSDAYVDKIKRKLDSVQTLDNPNAPS